MEHWLVLFFGRGLQSRLGVSVSVVWVHWFVLEGFHVSCSGANITVLALAVWLVGVTLTKTLDEQLGFLLGQSSLRDRLTVLHLTRRLVNFLSRRARKSKILKPFILRSFKHVDVLKVFKSLELVRRLALLHFKGFLLQFSLLVLLPNLSE